MPSPRVLAVLIIPALALTLGGPPAGAADTKRKKIVTYLVNLEVDGRTVVGSFASTEKVTAEFVANPATGGDNPTSWTGEGTLNFGPIENSGLPAGCTLTNPAPTGTMKTSLSKTGGSLEVNWSTMTTPPGAGVVTCPGGIAAPVAGFPPAEPFLLLEPKQFTIAETGGSQQLSGKFSTAEGIVENTGTLKVTKREECEPKVKKVTTYPPGQQTSLSKMVGRGFSPGEKVTADTKVEFELEDGSVMRLTPGASYKEDAKCEGFVDKSRSFKGTLLLGKIWANVTKVFGGSDRYEFQGEYHATGVRGTRFWLDFSKKRDKTTVGKGSVWVQALTKGGRLTGPKVIVKAGQTATTGKNRKVVVRKTKASDAFPFGANAR